jgi:hypothetical protein
VRIAAGEAGNTVVAAAAGEGGHIAAAVVVAEEEGRIVAVAGEVGMKGSWMLEAE